MRRRWQVRILRHDGDAHPLGLTMSRFAELNRTQSRTPFPYPPPVPYVVLLGDSIFENQTDTAGAPDVVGQLRAVTPLSWQAQGVCAIDGSTTGDLAGRLERLPKDAAHLVISFGGDDALLELEILEAPVGSAAEGLDLIGERIGSFEKAHGAYPRLGARA